MQEFASRCRVSAPEVENPPAWSDGWTKFREGVINQGLYYMAWLTAHRSAFDALVRDRLGALAAAQVLWSAPA